MRVTGTVQGVGFRPFVYRHAARLDLRGWVQNDSAGVLIEVEGDETAVEELRRLLVDDPPPLARVATDTPSVIPVAGDAGFAIVASAGGGAPTAPVSIDTATCGACLAEVDDPTDRRHRYPFTNCTDCGPRYTIVRSVPYDRPATT
ncbi:MAG: acylphosphatase, partial [Acidimicrobiia bacterium]|nr:acylphosphatase [Acidimicrobiia bacterium]